MPGARHDPRHDRHPGKGRAVRRAARKAPRQNPHAKPGGDRAQRALRALRGSRSGRASGAEQQPAGSLARIRTARQQRASSAADAYWVVPRLGTISPWASKATDIAKICGLPQVRRIERGMSTSWPASINDEAALLPRSARPHDRIRKQGCRPFRYHGFHIRVKGDSPLLEWNAEFTSDFAPARPFQPGLAIKLIATPLAPACPVRPAINIGFRLIRGFVLDHMAKDGDIQARAATSVATRKRNVPAAPGPVPGPFLTGIDPH